MSSLYSITNKVNGKIYIGQTIQKAKTRWKNHRWQLNKGIHKNTYLQNSWNKYGSQNFSFNILLCGEFFKKELNQLEKDYINLYDSTNLSKGYNLKAGGNSSTHHPESKKLMSKKVKEYIDKTSFFERTKTDDWALAQDIYIFWLNKSNGRGGNKYPGHTKISQAFNIGRGTATILCQKFNKGWIPNLDIRWCKLYSAQNIKPDIIHNEAGQQRKGKEFWNEKSPEWCKAIKAYKVWSKEKLSIIKLMKRVSIKEGVSKAMVKKFKSGWCPQNDENYMKYYGTSI